MDWDKNTDFIQKILGKLGGKQNMLVEILLYMRKYYEKFTVKGRAKKAHKYKVTGKCDESENIMERICKEFLKKKEEKMILGICDGLLYYIDKVFIDKVK